MCYLIMSHTCNLFSFVQHQSAASNGPHDPTLSHWNSWPKWLLVIFFIFAFVDYMWLLVVVNEHTCDSEVYLHLCVADISIWTACDAYCELSVMDVMFIWMRYVAVTEPNKLIIYDSFAECYTRQRGLLPSARVKTLGKVYTWQNVVRSGIKMASLPSVCAMTFGKEAKILCILGRVCRVPRMWHMAKVMGVRGGCC